MKQYFKVPMAAALVSLSLTFTAHADMQTRLEMIEALETTKDYELLDSLVFSDYGLGDYYHVLRRAAAHHRDPNLVRTLLNLPSLDKDSADFKVVVSGVYKYLGQFDEQDEDVLKLLLEGFSDDQRYLDSSLGFIFEIVAEGRRPVLPATEAARLLIERGADVDRIYDLYKEGVEWRIDRLEQTLENLEGFRDRSISPN